jgi:hypothetical protein
MYKFLNWVPDRLRSFLGIGVDVDVDVDVNSKSYQPLPDTETHIRLLTLLKGADPDTINCELEEVSLTGPGLKDYSALSYVWGPDTKERVIYIDGCEHWVSPQLFTMLSQLRCADKDQTFWVDAICINQRDEKEKTPQLKLMDKIYKKAERVVVWLREADDQSVYAVNCINNENIEEYKPARFLKGMVQILLRPYFSRTWCVQEFALNENSPELYVRRDKMVIWDKFYEAFGTLGLLEDAESAEGTRNWVQICDEDIDHGPETKRLILQWLLSSKPPNAASFRAGFIPMRNICQKKPVPINSGDPGQANTGDREQINTGDPEQTKTKDAERCHPNRGLRSTLPALQSLQVSYPEDKINGGRGLLSTHYADELEKIAPVKTDKPADQLYREASKYLLEIEKVLLYGYFDLLQNTHPEQPSWVLDFNSPRSHPLLADHGAEDEIASNGFKCDGTILEVDGIEIGTISGLVGPLIIPPRVIPSEFPSFLRLYAWIVYAILYFQKAENGNTDKYNTAKVLTHNFFLLTNFRSILGKIERLMPGKEMRKELWKTLLATASSNVRFLGQDETFEAAYNDLMETEIQNWKLIEHKPRRTLFTNMAMALYQRLFFRTKDGCYGISEMGIKIKDGLKGDKIVLLFPPAYCPFIVRPKGDNTYQLVSVAYIPPKLRKSATKQPTKFILV